MALVIRALAGLTLWAGGFSLLYALHGLGCGLGWTGPVGQGPLTTLNLALIALWLGLIAVAAWLVRATLRAGRLTEQPTLARIALVGVWAGLAGLVFTGAPVLLPANCL